MLVVEETPREQETARCSVLMVGGVEVSGLALVLAHPRLVRVGHRDGQAVVANYQS